MVSFLPLWLNSKPPTSSSTPGSAERHDAFLVAGLELARMAKSHDLDAQETAAVPTRFLSGPLA
jgi:hypothetical protein